MAARGALASSTTDVEYLGYDGAGNVNARQLRDGTRIEYGYDGLNRLTAVNPPGTAVHEYDLRYGYDHHGRAM